MCAKKIKNDITSINTIMEESKARIDNLSKKLSRSFSENSKLKQMIEQLKRDLELQLAAKDSQIVALKNQLADLNFTVNELNTSLAEAQRLSEEQSEALAQKEEKLNTAYYVVGTKSELKTKGVVASEGGVLGMGKTEKLSPSLDPSQFAQINILENTTITVNDKKMELLTTHPVGTYKVDVDEAGNSATLTIIDPQEFWKASKYLVIKKG
ncbi:MAG: hypothetical protein HC842_09940 [Cytophagales bacterium]|nr:hypothetical protein [Cytophagales bacterium]